MTFRPSLLHPASPTVELVVIPLAFALGLVIGFARASLDRALMSPMSISKTLKYHVGFTTCLSMNGLLCLFLFLARVFRLGYVSLWPFVWAATAAYGATVGYGAIMGLYRKWYMRNLAQREWTDDEL